MFLQFHIQIFECDTGGDVKIYSLWTIRNTFFGNLLIICSKLNTLKTKNRIFGNPKILGWVGFWVGEPYPYSKPVFFQLNSILMVFGGKE